MKNLNKLLIVVMLMGAVPTLTSCDDLWEAVFGQYDNPTNPDDSGGSKKQDPPHIAAITITAEGIEGDEATIDKGDKLQLSAVISPEDTKETKVGWQTSDQSIATVSSKGLVTAKGPGTCTIQCTSKANADIYARFTINVNAEPMGLDDEDEIDQSLALSR